MNDITTIDSEQYGVPCVVVFPGDTAIKVVDHCFCMGAIYRSKEDPLFCVVLRFDVGPELYSLNALCKSLPLEH